MTTSFDKLKADIAAETAEINLVVRLLTPQSKIAAGWNTLKVGGGGLITGFDIAPDGTMVIRTDEYGAYRWSGTTATVANPADVWVQLINPAGDWAGSCYECVIAHNQTSRLAMIGGQYTIYISNDNGATWTNSGLTFGNADGNSPSLQKNASGKIIFDPNNADICYAGMPVNSGKSNGLYCSIDGGLTFVPVTAIAAPTVDPGTTGMCFDKKAGTVIVNGKIRSKRMLVPVGGIGIYETLDGWETLTEIGASGPGAVSIFQSQLDFDGAWYVVTGAGHLWRYANNAWLQLDGRGSLPANYPGPCGLVIVDPRDGHQGFVSTSGPNGLGAGFTSHNANAAAPAWGGFTGGETPVTRAADYDVPWLNHGIQGLNAFIGATNSIIDKNGVQWWSGNQSFWYFDGIPDYGVSGATVSNSVIRGVEQTVTTGICKPPGSPYPIRTMQDVGTMTAPPDKYPTTYYTPGVRMDAYNADYAITDSSFCVVKADNEGNWHLSAYSTDHGQTWKSYANQPDAIWDTIGATWPPNTYGGSVGGQIIAIDHNRHICAGQGYATTLQPVYTTNATAADCKWQLCNGLPAWNWHNGAFVSPTLSHPFAADYVNIGTCYALAVNRNGPSTIYKSTDAGANWSSYSSIQLGSGGNFIGVYLYAVPGHAGDLWLFVRGTGGGGTGPQGALGLFHGIDNGSSITWIWTEPPSPYQIPYGFSLGAPKTTNGYPAIYVAWSYGYPFGLIWSRSDDGGASWNLLTGDLDPNINQPRSCAHGGIQCFAADPDVFGRLYFGSYGAGFSYYEPST